MLKPLQQLGSDFLSTFVFVALALLTHNYVLATGAAIAVGVTQFGALLLLGRKVTAMQVLSVALVIVLGGATIYFNDTRFVRLKPSVAHVAVGTVMFKRGWQQRYMPEIVRTWMREGELAAWGYVWAVYQVFLGVCNAAFAIQFSMTTWAAFTFAAPIATFALFAVQYIAMRTLIRSRIRAAAPVEREAGGA